MDNLISATQESELGKLGLKLMKEANSLPDYDISGLAVNFRRTGENIRINISMIERVITPENSLYDKINEMLKAQ